ncbi:MAG: S8 family serine peptidase [Bacteroidales bacterium]|nr:S8 family serine peptidase [Bacteroidales bacterium]
MKKILSLLFLTAMTLNLMAQTSCYWVLLTDKQGSTFDPYSYFDAKAIERYNQCGADLYDISNYPVTPAYSHKVESLATESLGESRWLNAVAVMATPDQILAIEELPFVSHTRLIGGEWHVAQQQPRQQESVGNSALGSDGEIVLADQLVRMGGNYFRKKGINGKGMRIAVLDSGFPHVNTHSAFKHLRDNHLILKTWNFPLKKEDVYGWGSHGTMTLSCITGIIGNKQIGFATASEFLLARTEIDTEPFKEEVWWMQAMEWADKNGANLISSSLGYGKERHYTYEMDGRSYVAKAANMAARKGILVCNSAGNEGDDKRWKTIITPADADSVICVGGIEDNLGSYRHISFSSYGPSADGRLKPNVCAFGHAIVAKHTSDNESTEAYGTSFSCPLTTGFAACAWQCRPGLTAMQMKAEIEKSADLYPYYDYALGYGVPQASYFTENKTENKQATFRFVDKDWYIEVEPTAPSREFFTSDQKIGEEKSVSMQPTVFFKVQNKKGEIEKFYSLEFNNFNPDEAIAFPKASLYKRTVTVHYAGYTESFTLSDQENKNLLETGNIREFEYYVVDTAGLFQGNYDVTMERRPEDNKVNEKAWKFGVDLTYGSILNLPYSDHLKKWNSTFAIDIRGAKPINKWYSLGFGLGIELLEYNCTDSLNSLDASLGVANPVAKKKALEQTQVNAEFFQRIRIIPGGPLGKGFNWDLGLFANYSAFRYNLSYNNQANCKEMNIDYRNVSLDGLRRFNCGISTRLVFDFIGISARYHLLDHISPNPLLKKPVVDLGVTIRF